MPRKSVPLDTQTAVLLRSRRRCCICFGLHRDSSLTVGQIAHLDHDGSNNAEDNLAFLCFDHHDEYDSRSSQKKGLTAGEVKQFRRELHEYVGREFSVDVHFGTVINPKGDRYAGSFIRIGSPNESAEINLAPIPDGPDGFPRYAVTGHAIWGGDQPTGPNLGHFSFIGELEHDCIEHCDHSRSRENPHVLRLKFKDRKLFVDEESQPVTSGMNVYFDGEYRRA